MKNFLSIAAMIAVFCLGVAGVINAGEDQYRCGNANLSPDGEITLSDVTRMIDRVFISKTPLEIEEIGNVNGSPDGLITLSDISYLISYLYISGPEPDCACCIHIETRGECLPATLATGTNADPGYLFVEVVGSDLHVHHIGAQYQCCLDYEVEYEFDGNNITAREYDVGMPCDCICPFNLKSVLKFLDDGVYTVTLIGIDGDTIGTQEVTVPSSYMPITWEHGPCEETPGLSLAENIDYTYDSGVLLMEHWDAYFNCGFELRMRFELAGDTIRFYELNVSPDLMFCMCYYDISAEVGGIDPGEYVAEVYMGDYYLYGGEIVLADRRILHLE